MLVQQSFLHSAQMALLFLLPFQIEIDDCNDGADDEDDARLVPVRHEIRPVLPEHHTRIDDRRRPGERARDCVSEESLRIDARKARRQRDERANDGQHAAKEHRLQPVTVKPILRRIDVGFFDEEIFPVPIYEGTPAACTDLVCKSGAKESADHARE